MGTPALPVHLEQSPQFADVAESDDIRAVALAAHQWMYQTLCGMCDDRGAVWIDTKVSDNGITLSVRVARVDFGRIVGKAGRNARALRGLLGAFGKRFNVRLNLDIPPSTDEAAR